MNQASMRSPAESGKSILALAPVAGQTAQVGASIDRTGYLSAVVDVAYGTTGTPTGVSTAIQLQDSADGTTFANFGAAVTVNSSAFNGVASIGADLSGARQYVKAVVTTTLAGGSSPTVTQAAIVRLRGPDRLPAL